MSKKSLEAELTALAEEMREDLHSIAGASGSVKERIRRASRLTGFSYWRTFGLWYGNARRIDAHEIDVVRAKQNQEEALRAETDELLAALSERVALLEAALAARDEEEAEERGQAQRGPRVLVDGVLGRPVVKRC